MAVEWLRSKTDSNGCLAERVDPRSHDEIFAAYSKRLSEACIGSSASGLTGEAVSRHSMAAPGEKDASESQRKVDVEQILVR
jgi:hypothetical protein